MTVEWLTGDALEQVRALPDDSVDLVATSPPFLALRNYNDLVGQWGSEATPAAFLDNLLDLVEALAPKLAGHGSIAFELGDKFNVGDYVEPPTKSLTGVPTLFAWSLAYGRNLLNPERTIEPWRIRNVIVWARANPPVGALGDKYRPATSYITVATKSGKRWFDLDAVRTPVQHPGQRLPAKMNRVDGKYGGDRIPLPAYDASQSAGAPPLDHCNDTENLTWHINTHGSSLAHYAMWPPTLAERLILSMCPAEVCTVCGEPRRRITGPPEYVPSASYRGGSSSAMNDGARVAEKANQYTHNGQANASVIRSAPTLGWSDCGHDDYRPGHVLDPFAGTGTTLAVADIHGRNATGIDLDPHNPDLYEARYQECWRALKPDAGPSPVTPHGEQLTMI